MKKLFGPYGIWETITALVACLWLVFFNVLFIQGIIKGEEASDQIKFMVYFVDLMGLVIVLLPYISLKASSISNDTIKDFLDLPEKNVKFKFTAFSTFLGDQALASFLVTILILTGREALENYGGEVAAIYTWFLFLVAVMLATISLIRFILYFTKYHWAYYALGSLLSTGITFAFFNVGIKLAV